MPLNYLAYGSNLHPVRLRERVPSARLLGTVALPGRVLRFCKRSVDGSGKCSIVSGDPVHSVFGAVYRIDEADRPALDRVEGLGVGYAEQRAWVNMGGRHIEAFFYVASPDHVDDTLRPYQWYRDLVLAGVRYHRFPPEYLAALEAVQSVDDPDPGRRAANRQLLANCMEAGPLYPAP